MIEFLSQHWVLIYGLFMWSIGSLFGYFNGTRYRDFMTGTLDKRIKTHASDLISRQTAIDAVTKEPLLMDSVHEYLEDLLKQVPPGSN